MTALRRSLGEFRMRNGPFKPNGISRTLSNVFCLAHRNFFLNWIEQILIKTQISRFFLKNHEMWSILHFHVAIIGCNLITTCPLLPTVFLPAVLHLSPARPQDLTFTAHLHALTHQPLSHIFPWVLLSNLSFNSGKWNVKSPLKQWEAPWQDLQLTT